MFDGVDIADCRPHFYLRFKTTHRSLQRLVLLQSSITKTKWKIQLLFMASSQGCNPRRWRDFPPKLHLDITHRSEAHSGIPPTHSGIPLRTTSEGSSYFFIIAKGAHWVDPNDIWGKEVHLNMICPPTPLLLNEEVRICIHHSSLMKWYLVLHIISLI